MKGEKGEYTATKIIKKYGYEYHLVEVFQPLSLGTPQPSFMGFKNMALAKCIKINARTPKKKKL
jgi:hypothetical protein